jgi:hypothetical protein
MTRRRVVVLIWLLLNVAVFFVPGTEVVVGRESDGLDSETVSVLPVTVLIALGSLAIGTVVWVGMWIRGRRAASRGAN